jgi:multicomponent Na+:H+ antiporter subunit E
MSGLRPIRIAGRIGVLVALWLLAWGELSLANVLSGTLAAVALLVAFPARRPDDGDVRLSASGIARLTGYVVVQLVKSNVVMAGQILRPPRPRRPGVLEHRLEHPTDEVITLVSSIIALSPGTMTVDVAPDSSALYVHFFQLDDVEAARRSIADLERLAIGAIAGRPRISTTHTEELE